MIDFNLMIIGDEILHGSRSDKHFAFFKQLLESRGLRLGQVQYLPDNRALLAKQLRRSFSDGLPAFITGGIGATPDDHTRQAAADALDVPLVRHPEAAALINSLSAGQGSSPGSPEHQRRLQMADFPAGSVLIPNSYNSVAGFSIRSHYFMPGFPVMAHPMAEWVLHTYYADRFHSVRSGQRSVWLPHMPESRIAPLMDYLETEYPGIHTFSLPNLGGCSSNGNTVPPHIEFGIKAAGNACALIDAAWADALKQLAATGAQIVRHPPE
ncbi:competence/damage-inducible protein A [Neisseria musculi]|uniref:Molybdopterin binding domain protein n=1 Tax=Neisseria musculi TaxID=1815583 RepID=A0A7H1M8H9_9NEIS|nr:molybdopterin-binding protein [Neisseria musculi]QNT57944.1 putative molybdopterin binding domain protein [Neisseria musculi]